MAAAVVQGRADWGVTLDTIARSAGLGFIPVQHEQYDFVTPEARAGRPGVEAFVALLERTGDARRAPRIGDAAVKNEAGGIVLCGGKSTRMGTSKALLPFGPETMLQRVVRLLGEVVSPIVAVAAVDQVLPELPGDLIVTRDEREGRGPLEALRAGLKALPEDVDAAYVTSCDVPLLVPAFVRQMLDLARGYDIAVMEIDGFPHPLSAVYRRATLPHVESLLAARSAAAGVSLRSGPDAPRRPSGDDVRSRSADAAKSEYARGLRAGAEDGRLGRVGPSHQGEMRSTVNVADRPLLSVMASS